MDSEWFFEQFYASHYVPLALFREGKQEQMISSLDKPLDVYREAALAVEPFVQAQGESMRIFTLEDRGQYGLLRVEGDRQVALLDRYSATPSQRSRCRRLPGTTPSVTGTGPCCIGFWLAFPGTATSSFPI